MARPIRPEVELVNSVRALVEHTSLSEAARRLRLAEATVARLAAALPVTEGTAIVARLRLADASKKAA